MLKGACVRAGGLARRLAEAEAAGQGMRARVAALTRLNSDLSRSLAAREAGSGAVAALQVRHSAVLAAPRACARSSGGCMHRQQRKKSQDASWSACK